MPNKLSDLKSKSSLPPEKFEKIIGELLKISKEELFLSLPTLELSEEQINKFKLVEKRVLAGTPLEYIF